MSVSLISKTCTYQNISCQKQGNLSEKIVSILILSLIYKLSKVLVLHSYHSYCASLIKKEDIKSSLIFYLPENNFCNEILFFSAWFVSPIIKIHDSLWASICFLEDEMWVNKLMSAISCSLQASQTHFICTDVIYIPHWNRQLQGGRHDSRGNFFDLPNLGCFTEMCFVCV